MKILFGGAFNPPTLAHEKIASYILNKYDDCEITFLPTNNYYNKNVNLAPFNHRLNMVKIIKEKLGERVLVSDFEFYNSGYLGTYETLKHFPGYYFLIGYDSLQNIHTWINFEKLVSEYKFIVIPRDGIDPYQIIDKDEVMKANRDHFVILEDFLEIDISSSLYREELNPKYLDEDVYQYIINNKLYNYKEES